MYKFALYNFKIQFIWPNTKDEFRISTYQLLDSIETGSLNLTSDLKKIIIFLGYRKCPNWTNKCNWKNIVFKPVFSTDSSCKKVSIQMSKFVQLCQFTSCNIPKSFNARNMGKVAFDGQQCKPLEDNIEMFLTSVSKMSQFHIKVNLHIYR